MKTVCSTFETNRGVPHGCILQGRDELPSYATAASPRGSPECGYPLGGCGGVAVEIRSTLREGGARFQ
jgi:hypothetical protein